MARGLLAAHPWGMSEKPEKPTTEWVADPIVLVSKRRRSIPFPADLLVRESTAADVAAWSNSDARPGRSNMQTIDVCAGVTFLGVMSTQFALLSIASASSAPRNAPPPEQCAIVHPYGSAPSVLGHPLIADRETRRPVITKVHAGWMRVVDWLRGEHCVPGLFSVDFESDAPEMMVMALSKVLAPRTSEEQAAHAYALRGCAYYKHGIHAGALHDYAVRHHSAFQFVEALRQRGRNVRWTA